GEGPARDARRPDLEHAVLADLPAFADEGGGHVDPARGEVLAEHPTSQRAAQVGLPGIQVLASVRVDGLVMAAVVPEVTDSVADPAAAAGPLRAGIPDLHGAVGRTLVDAGHPGVRVGAPSRSSEVDRDERALRQAAPAFTRSWWRRAFARLPQMRM